MSRLFYAIPFKTAEGWDLEICVFYPDNSVRPELLKPPEKILASSLQLWSTQVISYPLELPKEDRAAAAVFETSLCQTIVDLWRWRLGDAVNRYHTCSELRSGYLPRFSQIWGSWRLADESKGFEAGRHICQSDLMITVPARDLVVMDICEDMRPLGHLKNGIRWIVDTLVEVDEGRIQHLKQTGAVDEHPSNQARVRSGVTAILKAVTKPLLVKTIKQPGPKGFSTELFFFQRQGFYQINCAEELI